MNDLRVTLNPTYKDRLKPINDPGDIPKRWRGTPVADLIMAQNFDQPIEVNDSPQLFVVTCIEFRFQPKVPPYYAYVSRSAGGKITGSEFALAFVLTRGVRHAALISHNDCGMTKVSSVAGDVANVLVEQGWPRDRADEFVTQQGPRYAIRDEVDSLQREFRRIVRLFPKIEVAPLFASVGNGHLYIPTWYDPESGTAQDKVMEQDLLML
jgi:carbonic anhydrase